MPRNTRLLRLVVFLSPARAGIPAPGGFFSSFLASPVVLPQFVASALTAHLNTQYSAMIWHMSPLSGNPSAKNGSINWRRCPEAFLDELKLAAWAMINGELRPTFVRERQRLRSRVSAGTIVGTVAQWMNLANWLHDKGIRCLADCDQAVLHDYGQHLSTQHTIRTSAQAVLAALVRLWAYDRLTASPAGIGRPPWDEFGIDDYLPAASSGGGEAHGGQADGLVHDISAQAAGERADRLVEVGLFAVVDDLVGAQCPDLLLRAVRQDHRNLTGSNRGFGHSVSRPAARALVAGHEGVDDHPVIGARISLEIPTIQKFLGQPFLRIHEILSGDDQLTGGEGRPVGVLDGQMPVLPPAWVGERPQGFNRVSSWHARPSRWVRRGYCSR